VLFHLLDKLKRLIAFGLYFGDVPLVSFKAPSSSRMRSGSGFFCGM
jgi:hypothetical protein